MGMVMRITPNLIKLGCYEKVVLHLSGDKDENKIC